MRKSGLLLLLPLLASCGSAPEPARRWGDPVTASANATCERHLDWSDGLSLEELLICVELRGPVRVARENALWVRVRKDDVVGPILPIDVGGAPAARRYDRTTAGAIVGMGLDFGDRQQKRAVAVTAEIERARRDADDLSRRMREAACCAYWSAVAAERRLAIAREGMTAFDRIGTPDNVSAADIARALAASARARETVLVAEQQVTAARAEVVVFVGAEPPPSWTLSDSLPDHGPEVDPDRAIRLARVRRARLSSIAASEFRCRLDQVESEAAPDLGAGVGYIIERKSTNDDLDFHAEERTAFLGFSITFSGSRRRLTANAGPRAALQDRGEAESEEVSQAVRRYGDARARLMALEKALPPAPRTGVLSDWIRAEEGYLSAMRGVVDAQLEFAIARSRLEAAVGLPVGECSP